MKLFIIGIIFSCVSLFTLHAQTIQFVSTYGGEKLNLNRSYYTESISDSIQFEKLTFYISDLNFTMKDGSIKNYPQQYLLIDMENPDSWLLNDSLIAVKKVRQVNFKLGIDSLTSVSGAFSGDLDPIKGMYWTWQSGYINLKLEGVCPVLNSRGQQFQYHLGGYSYPFKSVQNVELNTSKGKKIIIELPLDELFESEDFINRKTAIMSPGKEAVLLSEKIAKLFRIKK